MRKYLLTSITIAVSISLIPASVEGIKYCYRDDSRKFRICRLSNGELRVTQKKNSLHLALDLTRFTKITPRAFKNVTKIDTLELLSSPNSSSCTPKYIQIVPGSLDGFSELHNLVLHCMSFVTSQNPFKTFKSLRNLALKAVDISMFSVKYFADFSSLIELKLEDNGITIINPTILDKINEGLEELMIMDKINKIEPESFARFSALKRLVLNGGQLLEVFESRVFSGLDNLKYLDLDNNNITALHPYIFEPLPLLENLYLRHNKIREISEYTFKLKNLRKLYLAHNNLIHVRRGVFYDLHKLEYLNMSWNSLSCISTQEFGRISTLRILDLSNNEITCFEQYSFSALHLETLSLMNNYLTELDSHVFADLHVEKLLDLRGNRITCMEKSAFQGLRAEQVLLCYQDHMTNVTWADQGYWGIAGNAIKKFIHNDCGK